MSTVNDGWALVEFHAMGSPCRIVVEDRELAELGRGMVDELERRWSRFLPTSEISDLNRTTGDLVVVSPETYGLLERAEFAHHRTGGVFDPFVLDQLEALGYVRPWNGPPDDDTPVPASRTRPGRPSIELYPDVNAVRFPPGLRFDPGGIGKGYAADLVADRLAKAGAHRAQIELGGDVRLLGPCWDGGEWRVGVEDPAGGDRPIATVVLAEGGIATSGVRRRSWVRGDRRVHHLIDPFIGAPAETDLVSVTATASTLWWAEIIAKVALMAGSARCTEVLGAHNAGGVAVTTDGRRIVMGPHLTGLADDGTAVPIDPRCSV